MEMRDAIVWLRVVSPSFVAAVGVGLSHTIVEAAPILAAFKGQSIDNLISWCKKRGFEIDFVK